MHAPALLRDLQLQRTEFGTRLKVMSNNAPTWLPSSMPPHPRSSSPAVATLCTLSHDDLTAKMCVQTLYHPCTGDPGCTDASSVVTCQPRHIVIAQADKVTNSSLGTSDTGGLFWANLQLLQGFPFQGNKTRCLVQFLSDPFAFLPHLMLWGVLAEPTAYHYTMYLPWESLYLLDSLQGAGQTEVQEQESGELLRHAV